MLDRYMAKAQIPVDRNLFMFCPIVAGKTPKPRDSGQLSHTKLSELLKDKLGFSSVEISPHSLRVGGNNSCGSNIM